MSDQVREKVSSKVKQVCAKRLQGAEERAVASVAQMIQKATAKANKANARARASEARECNANTNAAQRLDTMKDAQAVSSELVASNDELREQLKHSAEALEKLGQIPELRTVAVRRRDGKGGTHRWPNWVRTAICEQLINGTPCPAIPRNLASDAAYLVPFMDVHVPRVRFCRYMRGELRVIVETLAALRIALAVNWRQIFTDGTSRRQTHLLTLIIGIDGPDGELVSVILRGAIIGAGETSEQQVSSSHSNMLHTHTTVLTNLHVHHRSMTFSRWASSAELPR